jgi:alpha-amylase/alpha-mannosidase (GH57 family)
VKPVALAFLWHMHQPLYRLRGERVCFMPWVRLHALRSYYDMARVLDEFPAVRPTFNFTATLIEQIRAYERGATDLFRETARIPADDLDESQRAFLFQHFFGVQEQMIADLPRYAEIHERRERARQRRGETDAFRDLSTADYRDLQVLFDLSWVGFKAREDFPEIAALVKRGRGFTRDDVTTLHAVEDEILRRVLPLYSAAAAAGRIEIATSPYAHPILPLLIDTEAAREALPLIPLPPRFSAPGDARLQVSDALALAERELGVKPRGLWPSEGSVSQDTILEMKACGIAWTASDEQVLAASRTDPPPDPGRPWTLGVASSGPMLVFRDHDLSDRIGFSYGRSEAGPAADGFLAAVLERSRAGRRMVLVALDGENPWEHYPQAGGPFLRALYGALPQHPAITCDTVSEAIARCQDGGRIERLHAGSWIHGDFGTWIGGPEKNRAWGLLGEVRALIEGGLEAPGAPDGAKQDAWASLRAAEGSDWLWWLDGQFTTSYRAQFDELYRGHLRQACEALGLTPPEALGWPIASPEGRGGEAAPVESVLPHAPRIDGFEGDYFEWHGAARLEWSALASRGTMQAARRPLEALRYGFTRDGWFCLRMDPVPGTSARAFAGLGIDLAFRIGEGVRHVRLELDDMGDLKRGQPDADGSARAAARKILEVAVPCAGIGLAPGQTARLRIRLRTSSGEAPLKEILLRAPSFSSGAKDDAA